MLAAIAWGMANVYLNVCSNRLKPVIMEVCCIHVSICYIAATGFKCMGKCKYVLERMQ